MDNNLASIMDIIKTTYPDKVLVEIAEIENEDHQSYKFLYESLLEKSAQQTEEIYTLQFKNQDLEREIAEQSKELEMQKSINEKLNSTTSTIMDFVKKFTEQEIVVSDARPIDSNDEEIKTADDKKVSLKESISLQPGVYGFRRPSFFTPLSRELSKQNVAKKSADDTKDILTDRLHFFKFLKRKSQNTIPEKLDQIDQHRRQKIFELLSGDYTNEEKYLRYFLLTPGLPKDYMNTLTGAAELGLDANVIIELLEQPRESFNMEIIETYVSETHKGTEFNLKKELADELLRGEWYISADFNGKREKFQLAPLNLIKELKDKLDSICRILENMVDDEACANLAQTSSDDFKDETIPDYPSEEELSSIIEFDEPLLNG